MTWPAEFLWTQAKKAAPGLLLAAIGYLFGFFLEPWSWQFVLAILVAIVLLLPPKYSRRWLSWISLFLLLGSVLFSSLNASYFVASDQTRYRLRAVDDVTFFEFQADNPIGRLLISEFPAKTILIGECDGQKVARLPRLPYAAIAPIGPAFANKIFFRRFPDLTVDSIEAEVLAASGIVKNELGENKNSISLEFGFRDTDSRDAKVTDIFPRSSGCIEDSIPLLPLVETLPWDSDNVGDMVKSAKRVARLFSLGTTHKVTPNDAVELRSISPSNKYEVLLDFLSHSLAYEMLDGNVFAEARAKIREGQCNLINLNANAFLGPLSALKDHLYVSIAADLGKLAHSAFPSCLVPDTLIEKFEHEKANRDQPDLKALLDCVSDRANPLSHCDSIAKPTGTAPEPSPTSMPPLIYFDLRDKEFEGVVIDAKGERRVIEQIEPATCPALRDIFEEREFVSVWQRTASKLLEKRFVCNSVEWNKDFERAHSRYKDAQKCAASRHLFEETQGDDQDDDMFDNFKKLRCDTDSSLLLPSMKEKILRIADYYDKTNKLESVVVRFRSFESMAGSDRVSEIVSAILQLRSIVSVFCEDNSLTSCIERYNTQQDASQQFQIRWKTLFDQLSSGVRSGDVLSEDDLKIPSLYARLKSLHNYLINIGLCNLSSAPGVAKELKMSDEEVCADLGLGQYYFLRTTSLASTQSITKMLTSPDSSFEANVSLH
jgi:hypothetical protein